MTFYEKCLTLLIYKYILLYYRAMETCINIKKLQYSFPKLTEANQQYILGVAEGLKHAQKRVGEIPGKRPPLVGMRKP